MESLNMWGEWERCAHTVRFWAHSPAVFDKPGCMKELHHLSRWIIAIGGTDEEDDRTQQEKHRVWEVEWVGRKAYQLLWVLSRFQIPLQCLFLSHSIEREEGWERGRRKLRQRMQWEKVLVRRMGGCYNNYLYSVLSVMFHCSLAKRRWMNVVGGRVGQGVIFSICLPRCSVNVTARHADKDKLWIILAGQ